MAPESAKAMAMLASVTVSEGLPMSGLMPGASHPPFDASLSWDLGQDDFSLTTAGVSAH